MIKVTIEIPSLSSATFDHSKVALALLNAASQIEHQQIFESIPRDMSGSDISGSIGEVTWKIEPVGSVEIQKQELKTHPYNASLHFAICRDCGLEATHPVHDWAGDIIHYIES